jgi:hypothetical protein
MPAALIVQLITTFGPGAVQLITGLIQQWETQGTVTAAQWATLTASLNTNANAQMQAQLTAAGIPLTDPHAVALLALTK